MSTAKRYLNIVIIGSGNAATVLGKKLKAAGHHIVQVFGRNASAASELAYALGTESTTYWSTINNKADLYLVAVSDTAIREVAGHLLLPGRIVVHTAGAVSKNVLKDCSKHYGVFYPLQSLNKNKADIVDVPIHIDASDKETLHVLEMLASSISKQVQKSSDDERALLHVAAVFCNNFPNYLYTLAEEFCNKEGLDFNLLKPLIRETAVKVQTASPRQLQTGPAIRNDQPTIDQHLAALEKYPGLHQLYSFLTESIRRHYQ